MKNVLAIATIICIDVVSGLSNYAVDLSLIWSQVAKEQRLYQGPIDFTAFSSGENAGTRDESVSVERVAPEVQTTSGLVIGTSDSQVHTFYEIPYARPPTGNLRFQPPLSLQSSTIVNASVNNHLKCMQFERACLLTGLPGRQDDCKDINMNEDCLVLNIYVPIHVNLSDANSSPGGQLAVMFYIHGGSFNHGSGYGVGGRELASVANVIVVTINYRLGPFGFLVNKESGKPDINGNQGLQDQQMALQWVQNNIENFGGDRSRVTIFGGSAGAQSVMFHTLSKNSAPLYWNAILQSAPVFIEFHTKDESQKVTDWLADGLCDNTTSRYDCIMDADAIEISNRQIPIMIKGFRDRDVYTVSEAFRPVIDGVEFTAQPLDLYAAGKWNSDKNMIIGIQSEELDDIEYFLPEIVPTGKLMFMTVNYYIFSIGTTDKVVKYYSRTYPPDNGDYIATFSREMTHLFFICPSRALARLAAQSTTNGANVYFYVNSYPILDGTCQARNNGSDEGCYLSSHGDETRFVMRTIDNPSQSDLEIENQFSTYWGNFARTGDPNDLLQTTLSNLTTWPAYTSSVDYFSWENLRVKAPMSSSEKDYEEDVCDFWDSLGVYMDPIPFPLTTHPSVLTEPVGETTILSTTSASSLQKSNNYAMVIAGIFSIVSLVLDG